MLNSGIFFKDITLKMEFDIIPLHPLLWVEFCDPSPFWTLPILVNNDLHPQDKLNIPYSPYLAPHPHKCPPPFPKYSHKK